MNTRTKKRNVDENDTHALSPKRNKRLRFNDVNHFLYNEGGAHVRPFIVLTVPEKYIWTSKNIAFFRSSGQSNAKFRDLTGSWFPTYGFTNLPNEPETKILKAQDICAYCNIDRNHKIYKTLMNFVETFGCWIFKEVDNINTVIALANHDPKYHEEVEPDKLKKYLYRVVLNVQTMVLHYFSDIWQIYVSQKLGGGIWEHPHYQLFSMYVSEQNNVKLHHDHYDFQKDIEKMISDKIHMYGIDTPEFNLTNNDQELVDFLTTNMAQINMNDDNRTYANNYCDTGSEPLSYFGHFHRHCSAEIYRFNKHINKLKKQMAGKVTRKNRKKNIHKKIAYLTLMP